MLENQNQNHQPSIWPLLRKFKSLCPSLLSFPPFSARSSVPHPYPRSEKWLSPQDPRPPCCWSFASVPSSSYSFAASSHISHEHLFPCLSCPVHSRSPPASLPVAWVSAVLKRRSQRSLLFAPHTACSTQPLSSLIDAWIVTDELPHSQTHPPPRPFPPAPKPEQVPLAAYAPFLLRCLKTPSAPRT